MPGPGNGCSQSKSIKGKLYLGSIRFRLTHPVVIAPKHSRDIKIPKNMRKMISQLLSTF